MLLVKGIGTWWERQTGPHVRIPAIFAHAYDLSPNSWGILVLSILLGILLLLLKIRSRSVFVAYTAFFVLIQLAWTCFALTALHLLSFLYITELYSLHSNHALVDHQRPSPMTLVIDEQLAWKASALVFVNAVFFMSEQMKDERPDIAKKFYDSHIAKAPGWAGLDISDFSLADKEYVLAILVTYKQKLADEKQIEYDKYAFPSDECPHVRFYNVSEERLAEFEDLLRQSIDNLRGYSPDTIPTSEK
jgi:hypothetical protein